MKDSPRIKSLKAILRHKRFAKFEYFSDKKNAPCCALGYAYYANTKKKDLSIHDQIDKTIIGLSQHEQDRIILKNNYSTVENLHKYCQELLDHENNLKI